MDRYQSCGEKTAFIFRIRKENTEAAGSLETSVPIYQAARIHTPKNYLNLHCRDKLKIHTYIFKLQISHKPFNQLKPKIRVQILKNSVHILQKK